MDALGRVLVGDAKGRASAIHEARLKWAYPLAASTESRSESNDSICWPVCVALVELWMAANDEFVAATNEL